jgi:microcystin-dependent protein
MDYSTLFTAIGTTYGAGNGTTTFNLPNLKGKIPVGLDSTQTEFDALAETGGAKTHTLTSAEMPSHTHTQNSHNHTQNAHGHTLGGGQEFGTFFGGNTGGFATFALQVQAINQATYQGPYSALNNTATNNATTATNQNTGGGGAHNNLQPYIVMNYIIRIA